MAFARSTLGALLGLASSLTSVVAVLSSFARIAEAAERVVEPELIADIPCDEVFFGIGFADNDGVAHEACDPPRSPAGAGAGQIPRCGQGFELVLLLPLLCRRARRFGPGRV